MTSNTNFFQDAAVLLEKAVENYHEGVSRIERDFHALKKGLTAEHANNRESRKQQWKAGFVKEWEKINSQVARMDSQLARQQPAFASFGHENPPDATVIPTCLVLGTQQISFENLSCQVPKTIPFPFPTAIVFPQDAEEQRRLVQHLLLRLLSALPSGLAELTIIDPLQLGQSIKPFRPLLSVEQLVPLGHALTRSDEIETALGKLTDEIEELIQHRFNDKTDNWSKYNTSNADSPLPYKIVLIFDAPEQLSDKSIWFLARLCENGPRCGVLPVIAVDEHRMDDRRFEKFRATLEASTIGLDALLRGTTGTGGDISFTYLPEQWPRQDALQAFLTTLAERCAAKARFSKSMSDLWTNFTEGETVLEGLDVPIGWTPTGDVTSMRLGTTNSEHHVLLAGKTGSGKSNLLHVLIHTLCEKYPPDEIDLYLLDYKESTEFNIYAAPPLPHARLVATESDSEYGVTVLRHLAGELEKRGRIFKSTGVRDFSEYRKVSGAHLPRVLLVIDEFQVLFSEGRQVAEAAEQLLSQLLKQGRSFGIHILLATQTLKGINAQSIGSLITQLGCRIALACGQEDSALILGGGNWAAAELRSPPEGIINNANGAKSGNVKFLIPDAKPFLREHTDELSKREARHGDIVRTRVFSGASLPAAPSLAEYESTCSEIESLLLGEQLTFDADALAVPLIRRTAFNILFSGYNDPIHDGLLSATLSSMAVFANGFEEIVYFNGRGVSPGGGFSAAAQALGMRFKTFDDISALPLQEIADGLGSRRIALIIDGLDSEKVLHPSPSFKSSRPGEPSSPADLLKRIAEEGPRKGTFVFAFIDRWQRCATLCKELFSFFELRVAYCMNEDDAGSLVSGGIGKFKGIEKPSRAVLVNKMTNEISWFRPYIQEDDR